jgi:hypothetical protein
MPPEGRGGWSGGAGGRGRRMGQGGGRGPHGGFATGPRGNCVCRECKKTVPHQVGIPYLQVMCPDCGTAMMRQT